MKEMKIKDFSILITKGTTPTTLGYNYEDTGINFYRVESFSESGNIIQGKDKYISEDCNKKFKRSELKENDILFSIAGAIGRVIEVKNNHLPGNINQALSLIRLNENKANSTYFKYLLNSSKVKKQLSLLKVGSAQLNLSLEQVGNLKVSLPEISQQLNIGNYFSKLDKIINNKSRQLELLEFYKKDMLYKIFNQKIRFKDDNGNDYPEWKITKLSNVLTSGNKNRVQDTSKYNKISVKLNLKGLEFFNSKVKLQDTRPFYIREEGEIIIGKQNLTKGSLAIVEKEFAGCICSNAIMSFKSEINKFIYYYISRDQFLNTVKQHETGSAQKEISEKDFLNLKFSKPSNEEINKITVFFTNLDSEILNLKNSLKSLNNLKKDMLEKMF